MTAACFVVVIVSAETVMSHKDYFKKVKLFSVIQYILACSPESTFSSNIQPLKNRSSSLRHIPFCLTTVYYTQDLGPSMLLHLILFCI